MVKFEIKLLLFRGRMMNENSTDACKVLSIHRWCGKLCVLSFQGIS